MYCNTLNWKVYSENSIAKTSFEIYIFRWHRFESFWEFKGEKIYRKRDRVKYLN